MSFWLILALIAVLLWRAGPELERAGWRLASGILMIVVGAVESAFFVFAVLVLTGVAVIHPRPGGTLETLEGYGALYLTPLAGVPFAVAGLAVLARKGWARGLAWLVIVAHAVLLGLRAAGPFA